MIKFSSQDFCNRVDIYFTYIPRVTTSDTVEIHYYLSRKEYYETLRYLCS